MLYEGLNKAEAAIDGLTSPEIPRAHIYLVVESDIHEKSMHISPEERGSDEMCEPCKFTRRGKNFMKLSVKCKFFFLSL